MRETRTMQPMEFSFGSVGVEVRIEGDSDKLPAAADHIAAISYSAATLVCTRFSTPDSRWDKGRTKESIQAMISVGEFKLDLRIDFKLDYQVPRRTLQSVVIGTILPQVLQTAGYYSDQDSHLVPTPPTSLGSWTGDVSHVLQRMDSLLGEEETSTRGRRAAQSSPVR